VRPAAVTTGTVKRMSTHLSSWLAGTDVTTPANDRRAPAGRATTYRAGTPHTTILESAAGDGPPRARRTGTTDALGFLAAVWVVVAAVPIGYLPTGRFDLVWNDTTVGIAAGLVTTIRLVRPGTAPATTGITCALGGWLAAAPFVLGYGSQPAEQVARWNDLASGAAIALLSAATMILAGTRRAAQTSVLTVGDVERVDP
jgi:SPW repeat